MHVFYSLHNSIHCNLTIVTTYGPVVFREVVSLYGENKLWGICPSAVYNEVVY